MNKKQIEKKLELKKITISNLDNQEMHMVQAGGSFFGQCVSTKYLPATCPSFTND
jgi:hypothetical protein